MNIGSLVVVLLALPLFGATINGLFGKRIPKALVGSIATGVMTLSFLIVCILFSNVSTPIKVRLFDIINVNGINIQASFLVDSLSIWMALIVTGIGTLIHLFSMGYMAKDEGYYKFFTYLNLFIFAMLLLILGSNYFVLFFGWEGVGICSYLLIGFHYSDTEKGISNSLAARKAFVMNRIGDVGLLFAAFMMLGTFGTLEFDKISDFVLKGTFSNVYLNIK